MIGPMTLSANPGVLFDMEQLLLIVCGPFQNAQAFISPSEVFKMGLKSIKGNLFLCEQCMTYNTNNISQLSQFLATRMCL